MDETGSFFSERPDDVPDCETHSGFSLVGTGYYPPVPVPVVVPSPEPGMLSATHPPPGFLPNLTSIPLSGAPPPIMLESWCLPNFSIFAEFPFTSFLPKMFMSFAFRLLMCFDASIVQRTDGNKAEFECNAGMNS